MTNLIVVMGLVVLVVQPFVQEVTQGVQEVLQVVVLVLVVLHQLFFFISDRGMI